jgi:hypothetical protein
LALLGLKVIPKLNIIDNDINLFVSRYQIEKIGKGSFIHEILAPKVSSDCCFSARIEMRRGRDAQSPSVTRQGILLDLMLYTILHNSFSGFLVSDVLIMKKRAPFGIMRWELEAVQAQLT